jgi:hypothetical protein
MTARVLAVASLCLCACSSSAPAPRPDGAPPPADTAPPPSAEASAPTSPDAAPVAEDAPARPDAAADLATDAAASDAAANDGGAGLAALSDDFSGGQLDPAWSVVNAGKMTVSVSGGALHLAPTASLLWFNASMGGLVHKQVTGDFMVTATVHPRKRSAPQDPPTETVNLGGLMARSPAAGPENYVFVVVGVDVNDFSVETKTTVDGKSTYQGPTWAARDAELRICRVGADLRLLKRPPGSGPWMIAASYRRPDLPASLQVGPNVYAPSNSPDLDVSFDEVTFAPAGSLDDCAR